MDDVTLELIEVPWTQGRDYLVDRLAWSRRTLGERLLKALDLTSGTFHTWVPVGAAVPSDLASGGLFPEAAEETWKVGNGTIMKPVVTAWDPFVEAVIDHLRVDGQHCCLVVNEMCDAGRPAVVRLPAKAVLQNEVYHLLTSVADPPLIESTLRRAHFVPIWYGVLSATASSPNRIGDQLDPSELDEIVDRTSSLFVGAFDGEGFVWWRGNS